MEGKIIREIRVKAVAGIATAFFGYLFCHLESPISTSWSGVLAKGHGICNNFIQRHDPK